MTIRFDQFTIFDPSSPPPPTTQPPPGTTQPPPGTTQPPPTGSPPPSQFPPIPASGAPGGACLNLTTGQADRDAFDAAIARQCSAWNWTWPLVVKAVIYQESSFEIFAISDDTPCGIEPGWTSIESRSFGISQITPACDPEDYDTPPFNMLLDNGHPNMTQNMSSPLWASSVFNPDVNLAWLLKEFRKHYNNFKQEFPGCTERQYVKMVLVAHNAGSNDVFGCNNYSSKGNTYLTNIKERYDELAVQIGCPDRF